MSQNWTKKKKSKSRKIDSIFRWAFVSSRERKQQQPTKLFWLQQHNQPKIYSLILCLMLVHSVGQFLLAASFSFVFLCKIIYFFSYMKKQHNKMCDKIKIVSFGYTRVSPIYLIHTYINSIQIHSFGITDCMAICL